MRTPCRRIGINDGRAYCIHGPMTRDGYCRDGSIKWNCSILKRMRNRRDKDQRLQVYAGRGIYLGSRKCSPDEMEQLRNQLSSFRTTQKQEYLEVSNVWLDQLDSPEK